MNKADLIEEVQRQLGTEYSVELNGIYKQSKDFLVLKAYDTSTGEFYNWVSSPFTWASTSASRPSSERRAGCFASQ